MKNKKKYLFNILLIFCLPAIGNANIAQSNAQNTQEENFVESPKESVVSMKKRLQEDQLKIKRIQNDLKDVEYSLAMNTKKYQKLVEDRTKIENDLSVAKKNLDLESENLKKNFRQTKSVLSGVILHRLDKTEKSSDLLSKKVLIEMLQKRLVDLTDLIRTNNQMKNELATIEESYNNSLNTEKELIAIVQEMETRKNELREVERIENDKLTGLHKQFSDAKNRESLERHNENRKKLKEKLQNVQLTEEIKVAETIKPNATESTDVVASNLFASPLKSYVDFNYEKKGVTYKFNGKNEIRSPKAGNIVYTGVLSTFGNILMIDHGDDTRSVLLGHYDYYVKNGDKVDGGAILGHTKATKVNPDSDGKLYYEIRKKNIAQNTYLLLDKRSLPKNFLR